MTQREQFEKWMIEEAKIIIGSDDPYPKGLERDYYILEGKEVRPEPMLEWARYMEHCNRTVKRTEIKDAAVSTVFLGLNHQYGDGPPLLFETMIFGGPHSEYQTRCSTYEEAEEMHKVALRLALNGAPHKDLSYEKKEGE